MLDSLTISGIVAFTFDWLLRIVFLLYIPRKRTPSAAIAWLLVVFLLPGLGIVLFLLIGSPKLSRSRRRTQELVDIQIQKSVGGLPDSLENLTEVQKERYEPSIKLGQALGKLPLFSGNSATILPDYDQAISEITKQIKKAHEFVHLEYFIIALDKTTKPLFDELEKAIQRGVKVRVLFDAARYRSYPGHKHMRQELTRMGVQWHKMLPIKLGKGYNRPDLRNHRKIVVVDDVVAFLGSQNLVDKTYHRKDNIYYDELVVKMQGPIVRQASAVFAGDWFAETGQRLGKLTYPSLRPLPKPTGTVLAQLVPSGPNYDEPNNLQLFIQLIHSARNKLVITNPYFIPDEALLTACTSAAKRGVEVTIINSESVDQIMVGYAQRSYYEELLEAGIKIYLYKSPILLHSKHMTIDDDIAVIGSSNMDIRSFALDLECGVTLYDKQVVKDLRAIQQQNVARSNQITLSTWRQRKLRYKFLESVTRLTSSLQ